jgi:hypothetical protein
MNRKEFIGTLFGTTVWSSIPRWKEKHWVASTIRSTDSPTMLVVTPEGVFSIASETWKELSASGEMKPSVFRSNAEAVPETIWTQEQRYFVMSVKSFRYDSAENIAMRIKDLVEGTT